ncbi:MAG: hypothetical protein QOI31_535 [Solirubrobacterales bacterium]|jgi:hypothetical protein|nr:hypothetical protein [Solirubrobacterales bacterium]
MPITADQSAVLEMLLTGGQSFDDLDDLFGVDEGETFERARSALEELGGADPDRNVGLTEYLLGQADPIGRADAVRHLRQDASDRELADTVVTELTALYPAAELPKLPQAPAGSRFGGRQTAPVSQPAGEPLPQKDGSGGFSSKQTRLIAGLGGAAILLIVAILAIAGVFSGDDEPSGTTSASSDTGQTPEDPLDPSTPIPDGEEISQVPLTSPTGAKTAGAAVVGISGGTQPYLDLVLTDLPDPPKDKAYLAWFMFDDEHGYPMAAAIVPEKGTYENRLAIPQAVAGPISQSRAIEISLSNPEEILTSAQTALDSGSLEIERPGETILIGEVPRGSAPPDDQQAPGEGGGQDGG